MKRTVWVGLALLFLFVMVMAGLARPRLIHIPDSEIFLVNSDDDILLVDDEDDFFVEDCPKCDGHGEAINGVEVIVCEHLWEPRVDTGGIINLRNLTMPRMPAFPPLPEPVDVSYFNQNGIISAVPFYDARLQYLNQLRAPDIRRLDGFPSIEGIDYQRPSDPSGEPRRDGRANPELLPVHEWDTGARK